jgi:hypothetical protein
MLRIYLYRCRASVDQEMYETESVVQVDTRTDS